MLENVKKYMSALLKTWYISGTVEVDADSVPDDIRGAKDQELALTI